jgi:hypothetical protein
VVVVERRGGITVVSSMVGTAVVVGTEVAAAVAIVGETVVVEVRMEE